MSFTNMACTRSINVYDSPLARPLKGCASPVFSSALPMIDGRLNVGRMVISRGSVVCSAAPESSTVTVPESKEAIVPESKEATVSENAAPAKPKRAAPAKALAKALPQLMEEDVIPSLRAILEAQEDLLQIELSFQDNRLEGSFEKNGIPYNFWAFFPDGVLTGPKGFSLSSHGSEASTVEPFLIDEKKITAKHVVFWVEKRLAAQGIIPVWNE